MRRHRWGTLGAVLCLLAAGCGGAAEEREDGEGDADAAGGKARQEIALAHPQRAVPVKTAAAPGWSGESLFDPTGNDWEPALAADGAAPYVYAATTRFGGAKACGTCPSPAIVYRVSADAGATWGATKFLCACAHVKSQADPEIEVANGTVYAVWMNVWDIEFARSTNHGTTFSAPLKLSGNLAWADKPILAVSPSGADVYVMFNKSNPYVVASHDGGATFTAPKKLLADGRYYFANGGFVAANGTATFTGADYTQNSTGDVNLNAFTSSNGGTSWTRTTIDTVREQPACASAGCTADYYGPQAALAGDVAGRLVAVYNGATVAKGPQRMYARRSTDGGLTWSARVDISAGPASADAAFPAAVGTGNRDVRAWFMDDQNGAAAWNVWYRRSTDGGVTWSAPKRISDATSGPPYVSPTGFAQPYGDYGEVSVTSTGGTVAAWGEGASYNGPGGTWINRAP